MLSVCKLWSGVPLVYQYARPGMDLFLALILILFLCGFACSSVVLLSSVVGCILFLPCVF